MNSRRSLACALCAAAIAMAIAAGCASKDMSSPSPTATGFPSNPPAGTATPTMQFSVYFLRNSKVTAAHRRVPPLQRVTVAAFRQLLAGPTASEQGAGLSSAVPGDLDIRGVSISGHTAVVNVSGGLVMGGVQLTLQRLAQLTYTATQFSMVDLNLCQPKQTSRCVVVGGRLVSRVRFLQDGEPLAVKGSGIDFTEPVSRATFEEFTPAVFVESPAVGETVKSPLLVWGTVSTSKKAFWLQLRTPGGDTLLKKRVTTDSRSGTRGMFRERLSFAPHGHTGRLVARRIATAHGLRVILVVTPLTAAQ